MLCKLQVEVNTNRGSSLAVVLPVIVGSTIPQSVPSENMPELGRKPTIIISSPVTVSLPRQFSFSNRTSLKHASLETKLSQNSTDSVKVEVETVNTSENDGIPPSPSRITLMSEEPNTESKMPTPLISRSGRGTIFE